MTHTAYIGIGSNLGARDHNIREAQTRLLFDALPGSRCSPLYETEPVGGPLQPPFLNGVIQLVTPLQALALLQHLLSIEQTLGRVRAEHWGPRVIDLDLLLFDQEVIHVEQPLSLFVPHPRMHLRRFVLRPLCDLAAELRHPVLEQSIHQLLEACRDRSHVLPYSLQE